MGLPWAETALTKKSDTSSSETDEIDAVGFHYLSLALYPLVAMWAIYSLVYQQHKSWWSWVINALANGVYTFGFIAMTPQLFVSCFYILIFQISSKYIVHCATPSIIFCILPLSTLFFNRFKCTSNTCYSLIFTLLGSIPFP